MQRVTFSVSQEVTAYVEDPQRPGEKRPVARVSINEDGASAQLAGHSETVKVPIDQLEPLGAIFTEAARRSAGTFDPASPADQQMASIEDQPTRVATA